MSNSKVKELNISPICKQPLERIIGEPFARACFNCKIYTSDISHPTLVYLNVYSIELIPF